MGPSFIYSRKIYISTNLNCNLNCVYCYEKEKKSLVFNVEEAISILKEMLNSKTEHGTKIKLHGGEPFLAFPKIKQLCESIWEEDFPEYYHIHVTTNGTLVHGEIQEWLYNNRDKITLKLSLDGDKKSNDINRPKSFDLIDIPFFVKTWPNIRVNMTITPETLPYASDNIKFIHSFGFQYIYSRFSLMTDWSECNLEKEFYYQLLDLADYYLDNPKTTPCEFFSYDISWTLEETNYCSPCNVGNTKAYDFQTKKYYPCHMCFPSVCGEKLSKEFETLELRESIEEEYECCIECPFINICKTCYAENYMVRGSVSRRDLSLCKYQKIVFFVLFKYEYARILRLKEPTLKDIKKMTAIRNWYNEILQIENELSI